MSQLKIQIATQFIDSVNDVNVVESTGRQYCYSLFTVE